MELKDHPLLRVLNATQIRNFEAACVPRSFSPGARMIEQASPGSEMLFLIEGEVDVRVDTGDGEQLIVTLHAPSVVGEMVLLTGEARSAAVYARTRCTCACIGIEELRTRQADGDLATLRLVGELARVLAKRLSAVTRELSELEASSEPTRAAELKAFSAKLFGEWSD